MLRFILFLFICFFPGCSVFHSEEPNRVADSRVAASRVTDSIVSKPLLALLAELDISHDGTLKDIVRVTQQVWLRKKGKERWHVHDVYKGKESRIIPLLKEIGLIDEVYPARKMYDYALLLGATVFSVRKRLAYLIRLWRKGIRVKAIIALGGQRDLSKELRETEATIKGDPAVLPLKKDWVPASEMPASETDMFKVVFDQTAFDDDFRRVPVVFVDAPKRLGKDGVLRRPGTKETFVEWLKSNPEPGTCLVISSQPHVLYQHVVAKTELPDTFAIETVGEALGEAPNIAVMLDALARVLYQTSLYQTSLYQTGL